MIGLGVGFLLRRRGLTAGRSAAWPASRGVLTRAGAGCTRPWANDGQCDPHSSINRGLEPGYWTLACSQQVTGPSHMPQLQLLSYDHRTITLPAPLTLTLRYEVLCCYHCTAKPLLTQRNATSRSGWNGRHSDGTAKMAGPWKRNDPLNVSFIGCFYAIVERSFDGYCSGIGTLASGNGHCRFMSQLCFDLPFDCICNCQLGHRRGVWFLLTTSTVGGKIG